MTTYYDFVLGFIPLALFGLGGGLFAVGLQPEQSLFVGGLVATALIGHALFVNGPVQDRQGTPRADHSTTPSSNHPAPTHSERRGSAPTSD